VEDETLKEKFLRFYGVSVLKDKTVSERIDLKNLYGFVWQILWRRSLFE